MKVFLIEVMGRGGFAQYTFYLASALQSAGAMVKLVTSDQYELKDDAYFEVAEVFKVKGAAEGLTGSRGASDFATRRLGLLVRKIVGTVGGILALRRQIRAARPDVAHFQGGSMAHMDWLLARLVWPVVRRSGGQVFFTAHNILPHETNRFDRSVYRWIYARADGVIVHTQGNAHILTGLQPRTAPVHLIPHGAYTHGSSTVASREEGRIKLGLGVKTKVILFFGLIRPYKGLDDLIRALEPVAQRHSGVKLVIAGRPREDFAKYRSLIDTCGVGDYVVTELDYIEIEKVPLFFVAADVVALPYKHVYDSGVARLAIAYGRPIVASNTGGPAELVAAAKCGLIYEPGDVAALARCLSELFDDSARAEQLGANGRRYAGEFLSWETIADRTLRAYGIADGEILGAEVNEKNVDCRS